jgi:hypothetical protein
VDCGVRRRRREEEEEAPAQTFTAQRMVPTSLAPSFSPASMAYGSQPTQVTPPPQEGAFGHSLKVGLGLGLGFMGVALGVSLLARGLR